MENLVSGSYLCLFFRLQQHMMQVAYGYMNFHSSRPHCVQRNVQFCYT